MWPVTGKSKVEIDGVVTEFVWQPNSLLLDALLSAGVAAPYSCRQGQCGACQCQVDGGATTMLANDVLDDFEVADGARLACQTVSVDNEPVEVSYYF